MRILSEFYQVFQKILLAVFNKVLSAAAVWNGYSAQLRRMKKIKITEIIVEKEEIVIVSKCGKSGKLLCERCQREVLEQIAETDVHAAKTERSEKRGEMR